MSWRTVVISSGCKLDFNLGCLTIRAEETKRIYLDEIAVLIIESTAVSLTAYLMSELTKRKIKVVFCDEKRDPTAELVPYAGSHDSSRKIKMQMEWSDDIKGAVWTEIMTEKISRQADFLEKLGKKREVSMLRQYVGEMEFGDTNNREGHAAKVYFNAMFGMSFTRSADCPVNSALNYGYSLILSACNREISSSGYLNQLGIHHDNMFNAFNLGCDLMEPFRPYVDKAVFNGEYSEFGVNEKHELIDILNHEVVFDNARHTLLNGIKLYIRTVFSALNDRDVSQIRFCRYEL